MPLQFGGGRPTSYGYDPNITVMCFPVPKNCVLEQLVDHLLEEARTQHANIQIISRENVMIKDIPGERLDMIMDNEPTTVNITQFFLLDKNRMWLLQCAATIAQEDYEVALDVIRSFQFPEDSDEGGKSLNTAMVASGFSTRIVDFHEAGDRKKAEEQLELFTRFAESIDQEDDNYAGIMASVGRLHSMLGNYDKAVEYLRRAVAAFTSNEQTKQLGTTLNGLAWVHYLSGHYIEGEPLGLPKSY